MRGGTTDGNRYIDAAIAQGAAAIVTDSHEAYAKLRHEHPKIAAALVEHGRRALAELSAAVLGHPERQPGGERGDRDERQDDDSVSAGTDAAQRRTQVRADRNHRDPYRR